MSASTTVESVDAPWPEIESRLLRENRPPPSAFPLDLLPDACRAWVEASAQGFTSVDYVAQGLLGAVSALCGGRIVADVTPHWREPLVLWQALVGGPSTGKTPALALARRLVESNELASGPSPALRLSVGGTADNLARTASHSAGGVALWCDDLAGWMADLSQRQERLLALAGWSGDMAHVPERRGYWSIDVGRFPLSIMATLQADQVTPALSGGDDGAASRFLYAWPVPRLEAVLRGPRADQQAANAMLRCLARLPATVKTPHALSFQDGAVERLQAILPGLRGLMRDADGLEAAWIGKAAGNIVRLASLLCLMDWAQEERKHAPAGVEERHLDRAHALWADYFWPHAQAVFGQVGTTIADRQALRIARWLRRRRADAVSREEIRREALCQTVDADTADDLIERLERYGVLRPLPAQGSGGGGPRKRRWAVNPALWTS
jgi:hypothetical protein